LGKKTFSFPKHLFSHLTGKRVQVIQPRGAGKSHVPNYSQIYSTPVSTPIGIHASSTTSAFGSLRLAQQQALRQHAHQIQKAFLFGSASTTSPFLAAARAHSKGVDDPDFNFLEHRAQWDEEYYKDEEIQPPDLEGYDLVEPEWVT